MQKLIPLLLMALLFSASCKKQPAVGRTDSAVEAALIGDWVPRNGDAEYVSFDKIDGERFFGAYLRGRPLYTGTWKLEKGKLTIIAGNGTKTVHDKVIIKGDILDLDNGAELYDRLVIRTGEEMVKDLLAEAVAAAPVRFSAIETVEMTWNRRRDPDAEPETLSVKGWKMSAEVRIKGDFTELNELAVEIASFFVDEKGFAPNEPNVTEIRTAYTLGNYILSISVRSDPEPGGNEPAFVDVACGWLP